jgi:cell division protein FtsQ
MSVVVPFPQDRPRPARRRGGPSVRRLARFAAAMLVLCAAASFPGSALFDVRTITVSGNRAVATSEVLERAGLAGTDLNAFRIDAATVRARLLGDPRIADVSVAMAFPTRLTLVIRERPPVAVLDTDGGYVLLSGDAVAIARTDDPGALPEVIVDRLDPRAVVLGAAVDAPAVRLGARLAADLPWALRDRLAAVRIDAHDDALLVLRDGITVRLGAGAGVERRLAIVPQVLDAVAARGMAVEVLDLRVPGNVVVQSIPGPAGAPDGSGPPGRARERQEKPPQRGIDPAHRPSVP